MTSSATMSSIVIVIRDLFGRWLEGQLVRSLVTGDLFDDESAGHLIGRTGKIFM